MSEESNKAAYGDDEPMTPTKAFIESQEHVLNGLTLHAYGPERMWAAEAMGLRWGRLTKAQSEGMIVDGTYPGITSDVPIVIWVCTLTEDEARSVRLNPILAEPRMINFARQHKIISQKQKMWWEARDLFVKIMNEIHEAYGEPENVEKKTENTEA